MASNVVMQPRCIFCLREQYAPAVSSISRGDHPCVWCGEIPPVFTSEAKYRKTLAARRDALEAEPVTREEANNILHNIREDQNPDSGV